MNDHYWRCRSENKEEAEKWPVTGSKGMLEQKALELEIPGGDLALADLLVKHCGWEWYGGVKHVLIKDFGWAIKVTDCGHREGFSKDLNAMKEVYRELKRLIIWDEFCTEWEEETEKETGILYEAKMLWHFSFDLEGQVEAAIKILRKKFEIYP